MNFINEINDILWTYILIIMLLGCAVWFSIRTRFVQFRMLREMIILLSESAGKGKQGEKHVSSFQAFAITIASRVGTGNLAGVATAITIGGPIAIFNMVGQSYQAGLQYSIKAAIQNVVYIGAVLSANLGVLNLFPIPALDGGRILFLLIEAVRRKPMDIETESKLQFLGFVFLMGLMAFVIFSDIKKYMI